MAFQGGSFEDFLHSIDGGHVFKLWIRFGDVDGHEFRNESQGVFVYGQDTVDLNGIYRGNMTGYGIRWAAFLYLVYVKRCRKLGLEAGPFTDEWNDDPD